MRNLTIKRNKTFVGCLGKLKVYIEDTTANELVISGTPCRKLGELKSGEEKTFEIGENAAKVFVIADKLSKDYCNEYYEIGEGTEDIRLSGKNYFNLANGNAFRFDNNDSTSAIENRKQGNKKGIVVLCISIIVGIILGFVISHFIFSGIRSSDKEFSEAGMTITLTREFKEKEEKNFTTAFSSKDVAVFALKEPFSMFEGFSDYTLTEYGKAVIKANNLSLKLQYKDDLRYFQYDYTNPNTKEDFVFTSFVYKSDDAFWLIQFAVKKDKFDDYSDEVFEWAESVSFSQ